MRKILAFFPLFRQSRKLAVQNLPGIYAFFPVHYHQVVPALEFIGRKSMKCLFADKCYAQLLKKLTYQEILSYHASHEKNCRKKEVGVRSSNRELVPNHRFWTGKAKDAA